MHEDPRDFLIDGCVAFLRELPDPEFELILLRARPPEPDPDRGPKSPSVRSAA
ncbi:hypothetical protein [Nocardia anaemiae]|uniref:hypothetical protein n=1 Tax=Nocardia anaemiae TaxID=263910 RepID=UPI000AE7B60F|nr:hypothetical protein [Nocardia anaemiae]